MGANGPFFVIKRCFARCLFLAEYKPQAACADNEEQSDKAIQAAPLFGSRRTARLNNLYGNCIASAFWAYHKKPPYWL